jgi:hypothetical protein
MENLNFSLFLGVAHGGVTTPMKNSGSWFVRTMRTDVGRSSLERVMHYWGIAIPDLQGEGHASGSWHPGGPQPLDPGVRRDDVATLLPWTPRSVQHA